MEWFSFPLPAWWLWVVSIIGIMAFVMAVKPFVQAIWGKPEIEVDFGVKDLEGGRVLQCEICNPPIRHKILRLLGVTRVTAEDITAEFRIKEHGRQSEIFAAVAQIQTFGGTYAHRISLAGSVIPAVFGIAIAIMDKGEVKPFGEDVTTVLSPSAYCAYVRILVGGKLITKERTFVVTDESPYAYWEVSS